MRATDYRLPTAGKSEIESQSLQNKPVIPSSYSLPILTGRR